MANPNPSALSVLDSLSDTAKPCPDPNPNPPSRTPFTVLDQFDADLSLARVLQEQERAFLMLRLDGGSQSGSYVYEDEFHGDDDEDEDFDYDDDDGLDRLFVEDEDHGSVEGSSAGEVGVDGNEGDIDPASFESDEAFARALQEDEERKMSLRLMALAGLNDWGVVEHGNHVSHSRDAFQQVDPDALTYEELIALGEIVGTASKGLSADTIASLPSVNYEAQCSQDGNTDKCVICLLEYEDGDRLVALSCKHSYHPECINQWLQTNKVCPICNSEVSPTSSCALH